MTDIVEIACECKNYAWGKFGEDSTVATLKKGALPSFEVKKTEPYAELWMGTHPSGPAVIAGTDQKLGDWIKEKGPSSVGFVPPGYEPTDLPFLFKVLSVRTALSIQAHPDKSLAEKLFVSNPDAYKDPNHKPEMAIALTAFECMCGFRSIEEIKANMESFPELAELLQASDLSKFTLASSSDSVDVVKEALRCMFQAFMSSPEDVAQTQLAKMIKRLEEEKTVRADSSTKNAVINELLLRLSMQYPGDRGVFSPLILNFMKLDVGDSFFIGANEPHAYISGDIVECMALSDNVVRAGLTPKFKDVDTLVSMLRYSYGKPDFLAPIEVDSCTKLYRPPIESCAEFEVEKISLPVNTSGYHSKVVPCGSILLLVSGEAVTATSATSAEMKLHAGTVLYVPAQTDVALSNASSTSEAVLFRAHVNLASH